VAQKKQIIPATAPSISAPPGPMVPAAGVIATRPATAPEAMPSTLARRWMIHSTPIQPSAAAAVAICVTSIAMPAVPLAATADPALKPNQPSHNMLAPIKV
jgi:hypothetical protein